MLKTFSFALMGMAMLASLMLASCGSDDGDKPDTAKNKEASTSFKTAKVETPTPICPQVAVVRGLDLVRDYGNEAPDNSQLVSAAHLLKTEGDCEYTDQGIDVNFKVDMVAKRGTRLGSNHVSFPLFVAVLNPDGDVLNKNQMTVELNFLSGDTVMTHAEALHVLIPLPKNQQNIGPHYKILTGFQLNQAQADKAKAALKP